MIGRRLRQAREHRGLTRDKLGSDAGVAASTIAKLESNYVTEPGLFTVWAICKALQYDLDDLFGGLDLAGEPSPALPSLGTAEGQPVEVGRPPADPERRSAQDSGGVGGS